MTPTKRNPRSSSNPLAHGATRANARRPAARANTRHAAQVPRSRTYSAPRTRQQQISRVRTAQAAPTARAKQTQRRPQRKVPEALPDQKRSTFSKLRDRFSKKPAIQAIVREPTSGGIVFRFNADHTDIEILLIQDSKNRWTIPKGHIEPGETAKQAAIREIGEEAGLTRIAVLSWLGKIHFKYRRIDKLVLMTTQIYLVRALDQDETPTKEKWMHGIRWFSFADALEAIEYEDIEKLMLVAKRRIRTGDF